IMDFETRVIGFGGRRLIDRNSTEAKYINSPESPVYQKGNSIYGLAQAKKALRDAGTVVLVEGYLDLIALFQAEIKNVAAPLGTALTSQQVTHLKRFVEKFVVMFDGDDAGRAAMMKSLILLFAAGVHPHVVMLPQGEDPDTAVKKKGAAWMQKAVVKAPPAMEWLLVNELTQAGSQTSRKVEAVRALMPFIDALPELLERKSYTARVTQFLGLGEGELKTIGRKGPGQMPIGPFEASKISLERILLGLYVRYPKLGEKLNAADIFEEFQDERLKNLGARLKEQFRATGDIAFNSLLGPENDFDENFSELAFGGEEAEQAEQIMNDCLERFRTRKVKEELKNLTGEIHLAEIKNDVDALKILIEKKSEAVKNLKTL
ncbi:MAG: toprim domain-containing protein, partial [Deltaproteobacteria bacterium]|nr:toprim domain-containing protein [Deltaproteobacteria bacterium]